MVVIFWDLKNYILKSRHLYLYCIVAPSFGRSGEKKTIPDPKHILQCCNSVASVKLYSQKFLTPGRIVVF